MENYKIVLDQMKTKRDALMKELSGLNTAISALSGLGNEVVASHRGHRPNGSITIEKAAIHFMEIQSRPVTISEVFDGVRLLGAVCQKSSIATSLSKLVLRGVSMRVGDGTYIIKNSAVASNGHPLAA